MLQNPPSSVRADVWLWAARFFKTRSLAKTEIERGKVKLGGQGIKPARSIRIGDRLDIERAGEAWTIIVLALSEQRGPAAQAQTLYAETPESAFARAQLHEERRRLADGFLPPSSRPDKHARQQIQRLKDRDGFEG